MKFELRHLIAFRAVADELNFRRAAERIGIAQPALSRTIAQLEQVTGLVLFHRTTRVTTLTKAGQRFYLDITDILKQIDDALLAAQQIQNGVIGTLRVGYNDFAMGGLLPAIVLEFRTANPNINIIMEEANSPEMLELLQDSKLDVGFHASLPMPESLSSITIRDEKLVCILPSSHPLSGREAIQLADLANEDFILGKKEQWNTFHRLIKDYCKTAGFSPRIVQEAEHSDGIVGFVAAGMGVSIIVDSEALHSMRQIVVKPLVERAPGFSTVASWASSRRLPDGTIDRFLKTADHIVANTGIAFKH